MITTVHKERNSLPGRRVELYNEICDVFLGKRQASKGIQLDLTPAQKKRVLESLAWHMMEQKLRVISSAAAESIIAPVLALVDPNLTPARFLESVRDDSGLMIEQEKSEFAFAHLTFQEYLGSVHAKTQALESQLRSGRKAPDSLVAGGAAKIFRSPERTLVWCLVCFRST